MPVLSHWLDQYRIWYPIEARMYFEMKTTALSWIGQGALLLFIVNGLVLALLSVA